MKAVSSGCLLGVFALAFSTAGWAQESKSAVLAKELAAALTASKTDSVAAKDPAGPDTYVSALYIPGFELLAISCKYSAPALLDERIKKKEYKDIYMELNTAFTPGSKVFVEDIGADGVKPKRSETGFDSFEAGGKRTTFDDDWKAQKLTEEEYMKAFSTADETYAHILSVLIAATKK
jgi:hypothetical protein